MRPSKEIIAIILKKIMTLCTIISGKESEILMTHLKLGRTNKLGLVSMKKNQPSLIIHVIKLRK